MKQLQRCAYAAVALLIALASVLMFSGVGRAQAATVGNPDTVPLGGTALDDQFKSVLRDAHVTPLTTPDTLTGLVSKNASAVGLALTAGLVIGKGGLALAGYISSGDKDAFTKDLNCSGSLDKALVSAANILTFDNLNCAQPVDATTTNSYGLATVDTYGDFDVGPANLQYIRDGYFRVYVKSGQYLDNYDSSGVLTDGHNVYPYVLNGTVWSRGGAIYNHDVPDDPPITLAGASYLRQFVVDKPQQICIASFYGSSSCSVSTNVHDVDYSKTTSVSDSPNDLNCKITATDGTVFTGSGKWSSTSGIPLSADKLGCKSAWQEASQSGKEVSNVAVTSTPTAGGQTTTVYSGDVTSAYKTAYQADPDCVSADDGTTSVCLLRLQRVEADGSTRSCSDYDVWSSCANWYSEESSKPGSYKCLYGTATLDPLTGCLQYRDTYKQQTGTLTYTDPDTGEQIDPTTAGVTQEQPDSKNCWRQMISWNPADWVLTPIKCAAIWAFVPTDTNSWQRVGNAWNESAPAVVARTLSGGIEMPEAGNGCSGPPVDLKSVSGGYLAYDGYPLSACDEPMKTMAQRFKLIAQVLLMASTLWMVIRNITAMFNVPPPPAAIQPTLF